MAAPSFISIPGENIPQYAYVLAVLSGGIAYVVPQLGVSLVVWLFSYALLAVLFASIWPDRALRWAVWLCLPIILLMSIDLVMTWSINATSYNAKILARALPVVCLGAYVGSKLPVRKIAHLFVIKWAHRKGRRPR